mgnify:CR=1 FL=1
MSKAGRNAIPAAPTPQAHPDQAQIAADMAQLRVNGVADRQAHEAGIFDLGCQVGAIQMAQVNRQFSATAEIKLFEEIKQSNKFKDLPIRGADGNFCTAENIEDFCRLVFGNGYKAMNEESLTWRALGDSSYEAAQRLGFSRKQLRLIRSLPDAQRTAVAEAISAESKSEVVAIIEDLAAQLAQREADVTEHLAKAEDDKQLIADKDARINHLNVQLKRIDNAPPEEQLALVLKEVTDRAHTTLAYIRGDLGLAFSKLSGFEKAGNNSHRHLMAGWLGDMEREIAILRADYFLPATVVTPGTGAMPTPAP